MSVTLLCYTDFIKKTSIKTKIKICQSALVNINWFSMPIQISTIKLWNRKTKKNLPHGYQLQWQDHNVR